jgi:hypothetical protein
VFAPLRLVGNAGEFPQACHAGLDRGVHPDLNQVIGQAPALKGPGAAADVARQDSGKGLVGIGHPACRDLNGCTAALSPYLIVALQHETARALLVIVVTGD